MIDPDRGASLPLVLDESSVRTFAGMGYGLDRPMMAMRVVCAIPTDISPDSLITRLESLMEEPLEPGDPESASGDRILDTVLSLHQLVQWQQGIPAFGRWRTDREKRSRQSVAGVDCYGVIIPYFHPRPAMIALQWAVRAVNALLNKSAGHADMEALLADLHSIRNTLKPWNVGSSNVTHFLRAAEQLNVQVTHVVGTIYSLGQGIRSRLLNSSITDQTSGLGIAIAKHKISTARAMRKIGVPVPRHGIASDEGEAVEIAKKLGYPVVIKPYNQDQGRGVFAGLRSESGVRTAYGAARKYSHPVLVESFCPGDDYRLTVIHGRVVKIMHRWPGGVVGDGVHTVEELLAEVQQAPEHLREFRRSGKRRLQLDEEALDLLREQGLGARSIPEASRVVPLRRKSNISSGGSYEIIPVQRAHPDNLALAIRVAGNLGLDIAGVDLISRDISRPWHENNAVVLEVNAQPQIGIRDTPDVFRDILRTLLIGDGSIDCHLLVADEWAVSTQYIHRLADRLQCNAISSVSGSWLDGAQCLWRQRNSFAAARAMVLDRNVESLLLVMRPDDVIRFGLPVARLRTAHLVSGANPSPGDGVPAGLPQVESLIALHVEDSVRYAEPERNTEGDRV